MFANTVVGMPTDKPRNNSKLSLLPEVAGAP